MCPHSLLLISFPNMLVNSESINFSFNLNKMRGGGEMNLKKFWIQDVFQLTLRNSSEISLDDDFTSSWYFSNFDHFVDRLDWNLYPSSTIYDYIYLSFLINHIFLKRKSLAEISKIFHDRTGKTHAFICKPSSLLKLSCSGYPSVSTSETRVSFSYR